MAKNSTLVGNLRYSRSTGSSTTQMPAGWVSRGLGVRSSERRHGQRRIAVRAPRREPRARPLAQDRRSCVRADRSGGHRSGRDPPACGALRTSTRRQRGDGSAIVALIGVGQLIGDLPAGALAARIGEQRALIAACVLDAVALLGPLLAQSVILLAVAITVTGLANAVFGLARHAYLTGALRYSSAPAPCRPLVAPSGSGCSSDHLSLP